MSAFVDHSYSNNRNSFFFSQTDKVSTQDLEPIYTYRGHRSAVLSLLIVDNQIFSGGSNGEIMIWKIPENFNSIDPYDTYDPALFLGTLDGHTDAVWSLVTLPSNEPSTTNTNENEVDAKLFIDSSLSTTAVDEQPKIKFICSASADGTIKVWCLEQKVCVKTIICDENLGKPTCLAALPINATLDSSASNVDSTTVANKTTNSTNSSTSSQYLAASYVKGSIQIYDLNSSTYSQPVLVFETKFKHRVNAIIVHPTLTVIVSAHQDRNLRFWDYTSGEFCLFFFVKFFDRS